MTEAHERYGSHREGGVSRVYPALAEVPPDLFGVCVVGAAGAVTAVGDAEHEFAIMSVSKPFVFALVCDLLGADEARERLGVNGTGLPFNSLAAVARSADGRTGSTATRKKSARAGWARSRRVSTPPATASAASSSRDSCPSNSAWICSSPRPPAEPIAGHRTGQPGPSGMPSRYHAMKNSTHTTVTITAYGIISAITVPMPASRW